MNDILTYRVYCNDSLVAAFASQDDAVKYIDDNRSWQIYKVCHDGVVVYETE